MLFENQPNELNSAEVVTIMVEFILQHKNTSHLFLAIHMSYFISLQFHHENIRGPMFYILEVKYIHLGSHHLGDVSN